MIASIRMLRGGGKESTYDRLSGNHNRIRQSREREIHLDRYPDARAVVHFSVEGPNDEAASRDDTPPSIPAKSDAADARMNSATAYWWN